MAEEIKYQNKPWLDHYEEGVPGNITYENICLPDILTRTAGQFPDHMALLFQGYKVSYGELEDMVNRFAACLHDRRTAPGGPECSRVVEPTKHSQATRFIRPSVQLNTVVIWADARGAQVKVVGTCQCSLFVLDTGRRYRGISRRGRRRYLRVR